jgi:hypothetical protein
MCPKQGVLRHGEDHNGQQLLSPICKNLFDLQPIYPTPAWTKLAFFKHIKDFSCYRIVEEGGFCYFLMLRLMKRSPISILRTGDAIIKRVGTGYA